MSYYRECQHCGAHLDPGETCDCMRPEEPGGAAEITRTYNGKVVYTVETFDYSKAQAGDYVEEAVAVNAMEILPPAHMTSECVQMGEPYSHREDPRTGRWRATYHTFKRITRGRDSIWQYCGCCFCGETTPRGIEPHYIAASNY